jgi:hypothetical protein
MDSSGHPLLLKEVFDQLLLIRPELLEIGPELPLILSREIKV